MDNPTTRARALRRRPTRTEHLFWQRVRNRRFFDYKFRRQHWLGIYIADFVCLERKLIVELDGGQHALQTVRDRARDEAFARRGFQVIRYWNRDVLCNLDGVLTDLAKRLERAEPNRRPANRDSTLPTLLAPPRRR